LTRAVVLIDGNQLFADATARDGSVWGQKIDLYASHMPSERVPETLSMRPVDLSWTIKIGVYLPVHVLGTPAPLDGASQGSRLESHPVGLVASE
jgi:hypothetical protein